MKIACPPLLEPNLTTWSKNEGEEVFHDQEDVHAIVFHDDLACAGKRHGISVNGVLADLLTQVTELKSSAPCVAVTHVSAAANPRRNQVG